MAEPLYGSLDSQPVRWLGFEAWIYTGSKWSKTNAADCDHGARVLTKAAFDQLFGHLPEMPKAAFQSSE